ncbi:hypothetical protein WN51_12153 [Melipona quadrifasciata]|uniref:Uncharacterized protein n=1 Tax=Melipona quadrifasciata TaxID=166423 RepID=A0A0N0BHR7_9HYME|nr:hypothetical protein WN51_12153 [Melipona quadrifasciata]
MKSQMNLLNQARIISEAVPNVNELKSSSTNTDNDWRICKVYKRSDTSLYGQEPQLRKIGIARRNLRISSNTTLLDMYQSANVTELSLASEYVRHTHDSSKHVYRDAKREVKIHQIDLRKDPVCLIITLHPSAILKTFAAKCLSINFQVMNKSTGTITLTALRLATGVKFRFYVSDFDRRLIEQDIVGYRLQEYIKITVCSANYSNGSWLAWRNVLSVSLMLPKGLAAGIRVVENV